MGPGPRTLLLVSLAAGLVIQSSSHTECPHLWTQFDGSCYRLFGAFVTWHDANRLCQAELGSELASVHGTEENQFLYTLWRSSTDASSLNWGYWLGLNDLDSEGTFAFTDGSDVNFTNWLPGQPDDYLRNEDCGHVWYQNPSSDTTIGWNDRTCTQRGAFICKMIPPCLCP